MSSENTISAPSSRASQSTIAPPPSREAQSMARAFLNFARKEHRASLFLPLAILSALALVSYAPEDPSLNTATFSADSIRNWLGVAGALFADILVQTIGKACWAIPAILVALIVPSHQTSLARTTCIAVSLLLVSLVVAILAPEATSSYPAGGGGAIGEILRNATYTEDSTLQQATLAVSIVAALTLFLAATPNLPKVAPNAIVKTFSLASNSATLAVHTAKVLAQNIRGDNTLILTTPVPLSAHALNTQPKNIDQNITQDTQSAEIENTENLASDLAASDLACDLEQSNGALIPPPSQHVIAKQHLSLGRQHGRQPDREISSSSLDQPSASASASPSASSSASASVPPSVVASSFRRPSLALLSAASDRAQNLPSQEELDETSLRLEKTLGDYGVRGSITEIRCGPVITLYTLEPAPGVKASRVVSLAEDIARTMQRISVRVAVIPGQKGIGIELPNKKRQTVVLKELLEAAPSTFFLPLALGKTSDGTPLCADLADMPHLLIAGTTGAGKSVGINAMILSLLYRHAPQDCRLILVDPKMLELSAYQDIPHLLAPVITDPEKALSALRWTALEMERRYRSMAEIGARNIEGYRRKMRIKDQHAAIDMPYIVVIIDEMADLMLTSGRNIEAVLQRLAQMARAAGIHMIVATQRPSVDVITGTIKANFPTRISYRVASKFDSRTILNEQGAEMLLGKGDMLFMPCGGQIARIHGPFVGEEEVEAVCNFLREQAPPDYTQDIFEVKQKTTLATLEGESEDPLYSQALGIVAKHQRASTSFLQRQLQIGYNRAARIIEIMEQENKISLADATGKRRVLVQQGDEDDDKAD